jgi:hypothetical protein
MKDKQKLKLGEIKVESFTTTLDREEQKKVKGGSDIGTTSMPIFCK